MFPESQERKGAILPDMVSTLTVFSFSLQCCCWSWSCHLSVAPAAPGSWEIPLPGGPSPLRTGLLLPPSTRVPADWGTPVSASCPCPLPASVKVQTLPSVCLFHLPSSKHFRPFLLAAGKKIPPPHCSKRLAPSPQNLGRCYFSRWKAICRWDKLRIWRQGDTSLGPI